MIRLALAGSLICALAACSTTPQSVTSARASFVPQNLYATGPISQACLRSDRKAVSRERCGCVQAVADQYLSSNDQRRGASFFGNPEAAHAVRLSDTPAADRFWARWTDYGDAAGRICT